MYHNGPTSYPFPCTICPKRFRTNFRLQHHTNRHNKIYGFICPICGAGKSTKRELKAHINYHTRETTWPCKLCPSIFNSFSMFTFL